MDTRISLFTLALTCLFSYITADQCKNVTCASLPGSECFVQNGTATPPGAVFAQACSTGNSCAFMTGFAKKGDDNENCAPASTQLTYPGGVCGANGDCYSKNCNLTTTTCEDVSPSQKCSNHVNCDIGYSCMKNQTSNDTNTYCLPQVQVGGNCTTDYDCVFQAGCLNNTCTPYLSVQEGVQVNSSFSPAPVNLLCSSMTAVTINGTLTCSSYKRTNATADAPCETDADCVYLDSTLQQNFTIADSCKCGLNPNGTQYCDLGSAETSYVQVVANLNQTYLNGQNTKNCHTLERGQMCLENVKADKRASAKNQIKSLKNKLTLNQHYAYLQNAQDCVKYVAFNYDDTRVYPSHYECPKYSCDKKLPSCLLSNNPFNDDGTNITVALNNNFCHKDELCLAGVSPTDIFNKDSVNGTCYPINSTSSLTFRYPGEDCDETTKCFSDATFPGACLGNKCTGYKENDSCNRTEECLAGLYCNATNVCVHQVKEGENCTYGWDCLNGLGCYNNTCVHFGTIKTGQNISLAISNWTQPEESSLGRSYMCEYGSMDTTGTFCAQYNYTNTTAKNVNKDGFVPCHHDDDCLWTDGINPLTVLTQKCGCGYNADGQGYCPLPNSYNTAAYKSLVSQTALRWDNGCHTVNRFSCYMSANQNMLSKELKLMIQSEQAHLYYKAVDCAPNLSSSFISLSAVFIAVIYALLF